MQYYSSRDLATQEGRLATLTERGLSFLVRKPHKIGEHLIVSFLLPGEEEELTATAVVRWRQQTSDRTRWYAVGLEWLRLEKTMHFRLDTYLRRQAGATHKELLAATHMLPDEW